MNAESGPRGAASNAAAAKRDTTNPIVLRTTGWQTPELVKAPEGKIVAQMSQPMMIMKTIKPVAIKKQDHNVYVLDMGQNFAGWLQFIYLPNIMQPENRRNMTTAENYIVPQAMQFFGADMQKGKLLQLLVELDSLV